MLITPQTTIRLTTPRPKPVLLKNSKKNRTRATIKKRRAITRLDNGPAMEIRISSRCLCFKLSGLKLTGFAHPNPAMTMNTLPVFAILHSLFLYNFTPIFRNMSFYYFLKKNSSLFCEYKNKNDLCYVNQ